MTDTIASLSDAGLDAATIAKAMNVSLSKVYGELRKKRPDRKRKKRRPTSDKPRMIRGYAAQGIKPVRIAFLLGVSKAYVYKELSMEAE